MASGGVSSGREDRRGGWRRRSASGEDEAAATGAGKPGGKRAREVVSRRLQLLERPERAELAGDGAGDHVVAEVEEAERGGADQRSGDSVRERCSWRGRGSQARASAPSANVVLSMAQWRRAVRQPEQNQSD